MTVATATAAVYGNDLGNAITANSGANLLDGANGDDSIFIVGGDDTMLGRVGNDRLDGGAEQLRSEVTGGNTYLMADTNGDGIADLWLQLDGTVSVGAGDLGL